MMLAGRMRSGKTTLSAMYAASSAPYGQNNVLIITERRNIRATEEYVADLAGPFRNSVKYLTLDTRFEKDFPSPKDLKVVIFALDAVYHGPDTVMIYDKPSGALKKFLDRLDDPFAQVPYILFTCHMPDAIEPTIQQRV
jgi:hypothetical protein